MSQPAANVDSVIYCWALQEIASDVPASLWQRDGCSAAFSEESARACFLSQQLTTVIAAKMTASLPLTATDFSKEFKAKCRSAMDSVRQSWDTQHFAQGSRLVFQPGAKEVMVAVSKAQDEMESKNVSNQWVLEVSAATSC